MKEQGKNPPDQTHEEEIGMEESGSWTSDYTTKLQ